MQNYTPIYDYAFLIRDIHEIQAELIKDKYPQFSSLEFINANLDLFPKKSERGVINVWKNNPYKNIGQVFINGPVDFLKYTVSIGCKVHCDYDNVELTTALREKL